MSIEDREITEILQYILWVPEDVESTIPKIALMSIEDNAEDDDAQQSALAFFRRKKRCSTRTPPAG